MGGMRLFAAVAALLVLVTLAACGDPEPGSLADCDPVAAPDAIGEAVPPVDDAALQAWLAAGSYAAYLPESAPHDSAGPHGGQVRTFVNRALATSLGACAESHPVGAAAVKELRNATGLTGWAVMVKTLPGPGADAWYWYEVFSTAPDARPGFSGQADETCTGCHDGGLDAVRTAWPLR